MHLITQLTSEERVFVPADGPKKDILSNYCDSMIIERAVIEAVKQCSKFVDCIFQNG